MSVAMFNRAQVLKNIINSTEGNPAGRIYLLNDFIAVEKDYLNRRSEPAASSPELRRAKNMLCKAERELRNPNFLQQQVNDFARGFSN